MASSSSSSSPPPPYCTRPSSISWKPVVLQSIQLLTVVYAIPFVLTYVPSWMNVAAGSARRDGTGPNLPAAVFVSMISRGDDNETKTKQRVAPCVLVPSLLPHARSFRVAWNLLDDGVSVERPPDLVSALQSWQRTTSVSSRSADDFRELSVLELTSNNDTEWCLYVSSSVGSSSDETIILCRQGSLEGEYSTTSSSSSSSSTHENGTIKAHVSVLVGNAHHVPTPPPKTASKTVPAAGFRKNPNKDRPSFVNRVHPIASQASFGILAAIQVYLFVVYWNNNVPPSAVGKSFGNMWFGNEVWRALSGCVSHFDLWHIGLNMSAFYQLSQALQNSMSPIIYLGLNLSFMVWVCVFWVLWQYGRRRMQPDPPSSASSSNSTPTVGYSGVLFALSTIVTLQRHESCPVPFAESICFPTHHFLGGRLAFSLAPLVQLGIVQVILPRVSFAGHLAGIVVGFLYTSGLLPWSAYPSVVWPLWHLVYLVGIAPHVSAPSAMNSSDGGGGRRLGGDTLSWLSRVAATTNTSTRAFFVVGIFSGFALGWRDPIVLSYVLTSIFWHQSASSNENILSMVWKRAFCVYAVILLMTHAATVGAWMLLPNAWMTVRGVVALILQGLTLWSRLLACSDDVRNTDGIFRHTVGWTILQPLSHLQSTWRTLRQLDAGGQSMRPFPGEGRRLRDVESELV